MGIFTGKPITPTMTYFKIAGLALTLALFTYCKSKQKAVEAPAAPVTSGKSAGELQMEIATTRWPGTVADELKQGQVIYTTKCNQCHAVFAIETFGEKKWLHEIDDMSPKAKLSPEEKLKLTKYILSYRETKEKMAGN